MKKRTRPKKSSDALHRLIKQRRILEREELHDKLLIADTIRKSLVVEKQDPKVVYTMVYKNERQYYKGKIRMNRVMGEIL